MSDKYAEIEKAFSRWTSRKVVSEEPGPEWFTSKEMAERIGRSERQAQRMLRKMQENELLEARTFQVEINRRVYHVVHYRNK